MARYAESRVREIVAGARRFRTIPFPGADGVDVALRCLTEAELDLCRAEAQRQVRARAKKMGLDPTEFHDLDPEFFHRLVQRQILAQAFYDSETVDTDSPTPFFASDSDIAELDSATVKSLFDAYYEHQQWVSPFAVLSEADAEELADALGKGRDVKVLLAAYERETLLSCVVSMACALRNATSRTGKSSTGFSSSPRAETSGSVGSDASESRPSS